ncbi:hypothetical protein [Actinopolymorpha singaporensis]|uniref:hypothetical protein n=1 Tax=Actinopolymorpha singaporensis TaxID=117157 RepID=UPI000A8733D4|nr:hypothetical protein [Actinopolymorpha singaporensis]
MSSCCSWWCGGDCGPRLCTAATAGAWAGKKIVDRLPASTFVVVIEVGLVVSGALLLVTGG